MIYGSDRKEINRRRNRSEGMLKQFPSKDRENRPALTGYKPLKKEELSVRETMRLENSRGTIAMGGDEKKRLTLVITEKRGGEGRAGTERGRVLQEKGQRERPLGKNRSLANPGKREEGAFGFQLQPFMTRTQMMEQIKNYMDRHPQKALEHMMPFMVTKREIKEKNSLEEERRQAWRENGGRRPEGPDRRLEEKKQELIHKKQMECRFGQRLEKAVEEEKKTVWWSRKKAEVKIRGRLEAALEAEKPPEEEEAGEALGAAEPEKNSL